jgi:phosphatidylserine/phosphatidylglycerophosphate/cardiolipin synthase-like enzyme
MWPGSSSKLSNYQESLIIFTSKCINNQNVQLIERLIQILNQHEVNQNYRKLVSLMNPPFQFELLLFELLQAAFQNGLTSKRVIEDILITSKMAKKQMEYQPIINSVWTGPLFDRRIISKKSYETVKDMFDSAKNEIFVVGYNFSFKHEEIQVLLKSIEKAVKRNCRVNFIVNRKVSNLKEIVSNWGAEKFHLNIYQWKGDVHESYMSLHAKLIIVDQRKMLLTSANFSYHGFKKNIETGVLIENHNVIKEIRDQYLSLIRNNQMENFY